MSSNDKVIALRSTINLTYTERMCLMQLMPTAGTVLEQLGIRNIMKSVEMREDEVDFLQNHTIPGGGLQLSPEENREVPCEFTAKQIVFIGEQLEAKNVAKTVTRNDVELFFKFLPDEYQDDGVKEKDTNPEEPLEMPGKEEEE